MGEKFYISTAIAYTSGKPHIGNTYEIVLADSIARFKRQRGFDVYFQTGTDEHGIKIEEKARDAEVSPQEFVDGVAKQIKDIWDLMNTSYNKFVRTTDPHHEEVVQHIFKKMYDNGDIYKDEYFVRVLKEGNVPEVRNVKCSNFVDVAYKVDPRTHRVIMMGAMDNLVKGAAGQAIQNMNIMFGLDEKTGLMLAPAVL